MIEDLIIDLELMLYILFMKVQIDLKFIFIHPNSFSFQKLY